MTRALILASALFVACSSGSAEGDDTTPDGGSSKYTTPMNGTISGDLAGQVTAADVWAGSTTDNGVTTGVFAMDTEFAAGGTGAFTISKPEGATDAAFASSISFTGVPTVGSYKSSDAAACGGLSLSVSVGTTRMATGVASGAHDCQGESADAIGSWTLTFTSVKKVDEVVVGASSTAYWLVHGTLKATLAGDSIDMGTGDSTVTASTVDFTF